MQNNPVHGCYTPHQFHEYVVTGKRFANDNEPLASLTWDRAVTSKSEIINELGR